MKTSDLVFIGIRGSVVAVDRVTGQQIWATHLKGWDFVNIAVQKDAILATCWGEIFCLDALTGDALWHNPLKGFGRGLATIAAEEIPAGGNTLAMSEKRRREQAAAAAGAG